MSANDRQEGGRHYQRTYQHWDWVARIGMDYFLAATTKYLDRYRDKNGLLDLKKALHYLDKFIELSPMFAPARALANHGWIREETASFLGCRDIPETERSIFILLGNWQTPYDLNRARKLLADVVAVIELELQHEVITEKLFDDAVLKEPKPATLPGSPGHPYISPRAG